MQIDGQVAWWETAYLDGQMTPDDLLAALRDLLAQLPPRFDNQRSRLLDHIRDIEVAIADLHPHRAVEAAALRFHGTHPRDVTPRPGGKNWSN